jgi:hypothetical protein
MIATIRRKERDFLILSKSTIGEKMLILLEQMNSIMKVIRPSDSLTRMNLLWVTMFLKGWKNSMIIDSGTISLKWMQLGSP